MPSTIHAWPWIIPVCMLLAVSWPMVVDGRTHSTLESWAARLVSASADIPIPGAMTPPRYAPSAVTTQNVVAVPKSTMISGPPNASYAAAALTSRSAPISSGVGYAMVRPSGDLWLTTWGVIPKYRLSTSTNTGVRLGTTLERILSDG